MNNPNFIFNPYIQQYVPINSENGQQIAYLEKICTECPEDSIYDQVNKKCIKKKKYKKYEEKQIQLCKNYLSIKKNVPPIDRDILYKLLNIRIFNKSLSEILDINTNNINFFKDKEINFAIVSILVYFMQYHAQLSKMGILEKIFEQIYKIIGSRDDIFRFLFNIIEKIIEGYPKLIKIPVKQIILVVKTLIYYLREVKYLFIYNFWNCLYFVLGCFEYIRYNTFSKKTIEKLKESTSVIVATFDKKAEAVEIIKDKSQQTPQYIWDSIEDYTYYSEGGLLIPIFEKEQWTQKTVKYYKKEATKIKDAKKEIIENLDSLENFTKILPEEQIELLKKLGHMDSENRLYLERIGLGHLKNPSKQLLSIGPFQSNEEGMPENFKPIKETAFYYIDNQDKERYKSIYATASTPKIESLILKHFKKDIIPKYKIIKKELDILEEYYNNTFEYNKEKERIEMNIEEINKDISEYNAKKIKLIGQMKKIKNIEERKNSKSAEERKKLNTEKYKEQNEKKKQKTKTRKKINTEELNKKNKEELEKLKNTFNENRIQIIELLNRRRRILNKFNNSKLFLKINGKNVPKIFDFNDLKEKDVQSVIKILKKHIDSVDNLIDNYSKNFTEENGNIIYDLSSDIIKIFSNLELSSKDFYKKYDKILQKQPAILINSTNLVSIVGQNVQNKIEDIKKEIPEKSSEKRSIKLIDQNAIFNELLADAGVPENKRLPEK